MIYLRVSADSFFMPTEAFIDSFCYLVFHFCISLFEMISQNNRDIYAIYANPCVVNSIVRSFLAIRIDATIEIWVESFTLFWSVHKCRFFCLFAVLSRGFAIFLFHYSGCPVTSRRLLHISPQRISISY